MPINKGNPYHVKSGPKGGQFTSGAGGGDLSKTETAARKAAGVANEKDIEVGHWVEFIDPLPGELRPDGTQFPMHVLELRGPRLLVETPLPGWTIQPTKNVEVKEVRKIKKKD